MDFDQTPLPCKAHDVQNHSSSEHSVWHIGWKAVWPRTPKSGNLPERSEDYDDDEGAGAETVLGPVERRLPSHVGERDGDPCRSP